MSPSLMPQRVILCDGGLGNRLTSLFVGLNVVDSFRDSSQSVLYWPSNNWCRAGAYDIFNPSFLNKYFTDVVDSFTSTDYVYLGHLPRYYCQVKSNSHFSIHLFPVLQYLFNLDKLNLVIESDVIPPWLSTSSIQNYCNQSIFSEFILSKANELRDQLDLSPEYCIHIRQGDFNNKSKTLKSSISILTRNSNQSSFYICSDDASTVDNLTNIFPKSVCSGSKVIDTLPNYDDPLFPERSTYTIQLACIELVFISTLKLYHTSFSTYLFQAFLFGGNPASFIDRLKFLFLSRLYYISIVIKRFAQNFFKSSSE